MIGYCTYLHLRIGAFSSEYVSFIVFKSLIVVARFVSYLDLKLGLY